MRERVGLDLFDAHRTVVLKSERRRAEETVEADEVKANEVAVFAHLDCIFKDLDGCFEPCMFPWKSR